MTHYQEARREALRNENSVSLQQTGALVARGLITAEGERELLSGSRSLTPQQERELSVAGLLTVEQSQERARRQRDSVEAASGAALSTFPREDKTDTAPMGTSGWSTGYHVRCHWPEAARKAFMTEGVEAALAAGLPPECLTGHPPRRVD